MKELSCSWDGHALLHNSTSEKWGWVSFLVKIGREAPVHGHESYYAENRIKSLVYIAVADIIDLASINLT